MTDFVHDPDFCLRWPNDLFADEVRRLIDRARTAGITSEWREEVEQLLRQAFVSSVPVQEFRRAQERVAYSDEEPF
jgi:hypothetical protein